MIESVSCSLSPTRAMPHRPQRPGEASLGGPVFKRRGYDFASLLPLRLRRTVVSTVQIKVTQDKIVVFCLIGRADESPFCPLSRWHWGLVLGPRRTGAHSAKMSIEQDDFEQYVDTRAPPPPRCLPRERSDTPIRAGTCGKMSFCCVKTTCLSRTSSGRRR